MKATKPISHREPNDPAIDRTAARWLARRVGGLTPAEDAEFSRWQDADPRHATVFASLEETWRALDGLKALRLADRRQLDADLPAPPRGRRGFVSASAWTALAAAIVFAFILWLPGGPDQTLVTHNATTPTGGFEKLDLPDGSIVRLNTDSAVDVDFTRAERRVHLVRGEASFTVAKDRSRPFVVRAGQIDVRAVGTEFNVRLRADRIEVLVTEGNVRVDEQAAPIAAPVRDESARAPVLSGAGIPPRALSAGEKMVLPVTAGSIPIVVAAVAPEEIQRELAWQERRLAFLSAPLSEVVTEFNRYNRHKLVIGDARLRERRFGGTFRADNADAFVRLLESRFGVKAERSDQETVLRMDDGQN